MYFLFEIDIDYRINVELQRPHSATKKIFKREGFTFTHLKTHCEAIIIQTVKPLA